MALRLKGAEGAFSRVEKATKLQRRDESNMGCKEASCNKVSFCKARASVIYRLLPSPYLYPALLKTYRDC